MNRTHTHILPVTAFPLVGTDVFWERRKKSPPSFSLHLTVILVCHSELHILHWMRVQHRSEDGKCIRFSVLCYLLHLIIAFHVHCFCSEALFPSGAFSWLLPGHVTHTASGVRPNKSHLHALALEGFWVDSGLPVICPAERFNCCE